MENELEKNCVNYDTESQLVFERETWDDFFKNHVIKETFYRMGLKKPIPNLMVMRAKPEIPSLKATAIMDFKGVIRGRSPLMKYDQL